MMRTLLVLATVLGAASCSRGMRAGDHPADDQGAGVDDAGVTTGCEAATPTCEGEQIKTCDADLGWTLSRCPEGTTCYGGACACTPGWTRCEGANVWACAIDHVFHLERVCPDEQPCVNGTCSPFDCGEDKPTTSPFALPNAGWPRYRHDNRNSGVTPAVVADKPGFKWKAFVGGARMLNAGTPGAGLASGAVINQDNVIFVGAGDGDGMGGSFLSFAPTGKNLWKFTSRRGNGLSTPAVRADGSSYFGATTGLVYAVDPVGMEVWNGVTGAQCDGAPVVTRDGMVIYPSDDEMVHAFDFQGKEVWKTDRNAGPAEVDGNLAACGKWVYVGGRNGWYQLDGMTGKTNWSVPVANWGAFESSPLVSTDGTMYGATQQGVGYAIDRAGKVLWQKQLAGAGPGVPMALTGKTLLVVLGDAMLHAVDSLTGVEKWARSIGGGSPGYSASGPVVDGKNRIFVLNRTGDLISFDVAGNERWRITVSEGWCSWCGELAIAKDGTIYIPGGDGYLYAYQ